MHALPHMHSQTYTLICTYIHNLPIKVFLILTIDEIYRSTEWVTDASGSTIENVGFFIQNVSTTLFMYVYVHVCVCLYVRV